MINPNWLQSPTFLSAPKPHSLLVPHTQPTQPNPTTMASISSLSSPPNLLHRSHNHNYSVKPFKTSPELSLQIHKPLLKLTSSSSYMIIAPLRPRHSQRLFAVAEEETTSVRTSSEARRKLYIGNIPRTVDKDQLTKIVEEHGAVEKAEVLSCLLLFLTDLFFFYIIIIEI